MPPRGSSECLLLPPALTGAPLTYSLILDSDATRTGLRQSVLADLGIDWQEANQFVRVGTASDTITVPITTVPLLEVFGIPFADLSVLALPLPRPLLLMAF